MRVLLVVLALAAPAAANTLDATFFAGFESLELDADLRIAGADAETARRQADQNPLRQNQPDHRDGHASQAELDAIAPFARRSIEDAFSQAFSMRLDGADPEDVVARNVSFNGGAGPVNGDPLPTQAIVTVHFDAGPGDQRVLTWTGSDVALEPVAVTFRAPAGVRIAEAPAGAVVEGNVASFTALPSDDIRLVFEEPEATDTPWPALVPLALLAVAAARR